MPAAATKDGKMSAKPTPASLLQQALPTRTGSAATQSPVIGGKKKKKKKMKGKGGASQPYPMRDVLDDDDDDDDLPPLEPSVQYNPTSRPHRTTLSPELESMYLSGQVGGGGGGGGKGKAFSNATSELLEELLKRVEREVSAPNPLSDDSDPVSVHIRQFMQTTLSSVSTPANEERKKQAMYSLAQHMVQAGLFRPGAGKNVSAGYTQATTTSMPMDAAKITEAAFVQTLEHISSQMSASVKAHKSTTHYHTDVVISADFTDEEDYMYAEGGDGEHGYASEEEGEEDGDGYHHHHHHHHHPARSKAHFTLSYDESIMGLPGTYSTLNGATYVAGKKRNKKKKKKSGAEEGISVVVDQPVPVPQPGVTAPTAGNRGVVTHSVTQRQTKHQPQTTTTTTTTTMPAPRTAANPPPSSRAAGKQPMPYSTTTTSTTTTTTNPSANPPRSARAAAKAPAPPHSYAHNHPHHHPSPPSSNASAPQKQRPPGGAVQNPVPAKLNSKIWSTNTTEERERIKEFWLGLGEEDRRALVKVEKEAVLRKMKEQQKHSCSCAVCGRKRSVIFHLSPLLFAL